MNEKENIFETKMNDVLSRLKNPKETKTQTIESKFTLSSLSHSQWIVGNMWWKYFLNSKKGNSFMSNSMEIFLKFVKIQRNIALSEKTWPIIYIIFYFKKTSNYDFSGNNEVRVRAQVMMRDDSTGGWVPMSGGGLSNVSVRKRKIHHEEYDQPCRHEYLIHGKRISDNSVSWLSIVIRNQDKWHMIRFILLLTNIKLYEW